MTPTEKIIIGACFLAVWATDSRADEWRKEDTVRQAVFVAAQLADLGTTLDIENHPGMYETNPILGRHPSRARVYTHFAVTTAISTGIAYLLPHDYREAWQYLIIGVEVGYASHNYNVGLRFAF